MNTLIDLYFFKYLILLLTLQNISGAYIDQVLEKGKEFKLNWCTIGLEEFKKCNTFSQNVQRDLTSFGSDYLEVGCVNGSSKEDCMQLVEDEVASVTALDAGEVFTGGRYYSLVPILQQLYTGNQRNYYAVALIKKGTLHDVTNLRHLRGKKACFPGVGTLAGWILVLDMLIKKGGLEIIDCNNHVKNAINYFGPSCAVNSLHDKYNPIGDNSDKLCKLCVGKVPGGKCTNADPFAGFTGAFRCLLEAGEVAFLKHTTVTELTSRRIEFPTISKDDFELLCTDGSKRSVEQYEECNWGLVPSAAVVTTSAKTMKVRRIYQRFLQRAVEVYGGNSTLKNQTYFVRNRDPYGRDYTQAPFTNRDIYNRDDYTNSKVNNNYRNTFSNNISFTSSLSPDNVYNQTFNLFESVPRYGRVHNLLFEDNAEHLMALDESRQTYASYLGDRLDIILAIRDCPVRIMSLCVTSEPELEKCLKMKSALRAQLLKPELTCYKGHSHIHCMQAIRKGDSDVAVLDAGDVYTAGLRFNLIPFISEIYNLPTPEYYVVAVAKEEDPSTEIHYLRGKNTCHGGINTAAGWVIPMAYLLTNGWMRSYGCDSMRAAAEYFSKSCVPGALSTEYNTGPPYDNMCHLCRGRSYRYCRRDASEDYYGYTGALQCLVEGGGNVAFVKHTTVHESTDGKRREWWARNALIQDFQLLCSDGTRTSMDKYMDCNLGKVKSNAIVTRGGEAYNLTEINAYINLFIYAQQFYGRKDQDDFNFAMFYSKPPYADLIFQDAATQLAIIPPSQRWYSTYLGKDFMRAKRIVDCYASAWQQKPSKILVSFFILLALILSTKGFHMN
ncbi:transferrin 2 [Rhodnius prolixus]|uniref:transferrin 2 n=1 Tax=Rhodnius prolixus TaxID=13249 RepID=UPI003D18A891